MTVAITPCYWSGQGGVFPTLWGGSHEIVVRHLAIFIQWTLGIHRVPPTVGSVVPQRVGSHLIHVSRQFTCSHIWVGMTLDILSPLPSSNSGRYPYTEDLMHLHAASAKWVQWLPPELWVVESPLKAAMVGMGSKPINPPGQSICDLCADRHLEWVPHRMAQRLSIDTS